MQQFDVPDIHYLRAAIGWIELGNYTEANVELENISPELRSHPDVLEVRFELYAKGKKWDACREVAAALLKQAPERGSAWLHLAYATRRATGGGLQAAYEILSPAAGKFPQVPTISYNLACYTCQLGKLEEARHWLEKAYAAAGDRKQIKMMALEDEDLEPLWGEIGRS